MQTTKDNHYFEINMCGMKNLPDGSSSCIEFDWEKPDFYSVYVMERDADDDIVMELEDDDFDTEAEASEHFEKLLEKYPDAQENIYAMGRS